MPSPTPALSLGAIGARIFRSAIRSLLHREAVTAVRMLPSELLGYGGFWASHIVGLTYGKLTFDSTVRMLISTPFLSHSSPSKAQLQREEVQNGDTKIFEWHHL